MPTEPMTSAAMLAPMKTLSTVRPAMFMTVAKSTKQRATTSCVPGSNGSFPSTTGTNPAAP